MKFFMSHKCNEYCEKLGLINPKSANVIPSEYPNFFNKSIYLEKINLKVDDEQKEYFCFSCKRGIYVSV